MCEPSDPRRHLGLSASSFPFGQPFADDILPRFGDVTANLDHRYVVTYKSQTVQLDFVRVQRFRTQQAIQRKDMVAKSYMDKRIQWCYAKSTL